MYKKLISTFLIASLTISLIGCSNEKSSDSIDSFTENSTEESTFSSSDISKEQLDIETTLNLANNVNQEWTYSSDADAWVLSVVSAVAYPEIEDEQGVSVCIPGAYIKGIDTDGDGNVDVTSTDNNSENGV